MLKSHQFTSIVTSNANQPSQYTLTQLAIKLKYISEMTFINKQTCIITTCV